MSSPFLEDFHVQAEACPKADLAIHFLIIGGGIAGLGCAVALLRVGHRVTILERDSTLEPSSGPFRMSPNLTKILYDWGLKTEVQSISTTSEAISVQAYETNNLLHAHIWNKNVLEETRGDFQYTSRSDMSALFIDIILSYGGDIQLDANVAAVNPVEGTVTLDTGECIGGDVIVGADGLHGVTVQRFRDPDEEPKGMVNTFSGVIPRASVLHNPNLWDWFNQKSTIVNHWAGDFRHIVEFPMGENADFGFIVHAPSGRDDDYWNSEITTQGLQDVLETRNPILETLGGLATGIKVSTVKAYPGLKRYYANNLVLIGGAAHALPAGSPQAASIGLEDGAILAKIFSHLFRKDQISRLLHGYNKLRRRRYRTVGAEEMKFLNCIIMTPGERRNSMSTNKQKEGPKIHQDDVDNGEDPEAIAQWLSVKGLYGHEAEDEAENWWYTWGKLQECSIESALEEPLFD